MKPLISSLFLSSLFWFLAITGINAQTLHFFEVIQASAPGSLKDQQLIASEIDQIQSATGLRLQRYAFDRNDPAIVDALKDLRLGAEDVVWFYYSGHGSNAGDGYPQFQNAAGNIKMTKVHRLLKNKSPKFCLTVFDCCNVGITRRAERSQGNVHSLRAPNVSANYRLLFEQTSGDLMVASSSDNYYSYGSPETGGFFSSSFFNAIHRTPLETAEEKENAWKLILKKSKTDTNQLCRDFGKTEQAPKYNGQIHTATENVPAATNDLENMLTVFIDQAVQTIDIIFQTINSESN